MAPSVKIKDGRRVAAEQCSWCDGYLLPTYDLIRVCWGQAVVTATLSRAGLGLLVLAGRIFTLFWSAGLHPVAACTALRA